MKYFSFDTSVICAAASIFIPTATMTNAVPGFWAGVTIDLNNCFVKELCRKGK
jgi:hypothetical protein